MPKSTLRAPTTMRLAFAATCASALASAPLFAPAAERAPPADVSTHAACGSGGDRRPCAPGIATFDAKPVVGVILGEDAQAGVRIVGVTPDGPAEKGGLRSGDRLVRIDGRAIDGADARARVASARRLLQDLDVARKVALTYARDGRETTVDVAPKLDRRIVIATVDGGVRDPDGEVVVRIGDDGKARIESRTVRIVRHDGASPTAGTDDEGPAAGPHPRVIRIECRGGDRTQCERDAMASLPAGAAAGGAHGGAHGGVRRIVRIECRDGGATCTKTDSTPEADGDAADIADRLAGDLPAQVVSDIVVRRRCAPGGDCGGGDLVAEAFRWNGLNLASVDAQLGRYFGTETGVLVLSAGPQLSGLQAGDVILRVDGKPVKTPREVMDVLRTKATDATSTVDYLRDRKAGTLQLKTPEARLPDLSLDEGALRGLRHGIALRPLSRDAVD